MQVWLVSACRVMYFPNNSWKVVSNFVTLDLKVNMVSHDSAFLDGDM